jgi:uncharacterized SAM-binding protein YcdF (DUF218 family)
LSPVNGTGGRKGIARQAAAGAILATLTAVAAHVLGVQQLLRTPGIVLYLPAALVGAIMGATRLRPVLWISAAAVALICVVVAYTPLVSNLARPLIRRDPIPNRVDAIAVLSGGLTPDGMMRSVTLDRLLTGLALAKSGLARNLVISRESRSFGGKVVSDSVDQHRILGLAAPSAQVHFVDSVLTTRTEALRMKAVAQARGWSTVAVVTSPMHTRRACATFEAVGFRVVCVPADARDSGLPDGSTGADRLHAFQSWLYETFASSSYRRRGWIP